jgi:hypothetical protein
VKAEPFALIRPVRKLNRLRNESWASGPRAERMTRPRPLSPHPICALDAKAISKVSSLTTQMRLGVPQQIVKRTLRCPTTRTRCQSKHRIIGRSIPG